MPQQRFVEQFESSVISYGSKTSIAGKSILSEFESSVISYGSKTSMLIRNLETLV